MPGKLKEEIAALLQKVVKLSNPTSLHLLDERRFEEFFDAVAEAGLEPSHRMIDENWPSQGIVMLGGNPAKSDYVQDRAYGLLDEWKAKRQG
ncbi:MAG: hypothetical protein ACI8R4_001315 [Paracoccaceae bacterium]|jgi:hypothetical protein